MSQIYHQKRRTLTGDGEWKVEGNEVFVLAHNPDELQLEAGQMLKTYYMYTVNDVHIAKYRRQVTSYYGKSLAILCRLHFSLAQKH